MYEKEVSNMSIYNKKSKRAFTAVIITILIVAMIVPILASLVV